MKYRSWSKSMIRVAPIPVIGGHLGSVFFIALALLSLLFSAVSPDSFSGLRTGLFNAAAPLVSVVVVPVHRASAFVRDVSGIAQLQDENQRLISENEKLREWYQQALHLGAENKILRDLLTLRVEPQNRYVTARVLTDGGNAFARSVLVSAGTEQGVEKGHAVVSAQGVVGRVLESGADSARVLLMTDINSRVPVLIEGEAQHAILAGQNDETPTLIHLPKDYEPPEGARVVTSGNGGLFPPGLPVGRIIAGEGDSRILVEPFADFSRLVFVRIVDRGDDHSLVSAPSGEIAP